MKRKAIVKIEPVIILIVAFLFLYTLGKLCYVVLSDKVDGENLQEKAKEITTTEKILYANRGNIFDINGEKLAESVNSYTAIAILKESGTPDPNYPRHVVDVKMTAKKLAPILNMSKKELEKKINNGIKNNKYQVELRPGGAGLTEKTKAEIEALELPGIGFMKESKKRYYSQSTFASYIIGYAKTNENGEIVGELGVEGFYDDLLSGINGYTKYLKYSSGKYKIPNTPEETKEAENGSDIYLTIERQIQLLLEFAVKEVQEKFDSEWAIFTVMDANTGAIVGSATNPNFNPNDTNTIEGYLNPLVSYQYEPGSVMKTFSFASAIEEGKYDGDKKFKSGYIKLDDAKGTIIRDSNREGWGTITFDMGFAHSSNVAATMLALDLGADKLTEYYEKLGFGKKTGIELANEVEGKIQFSRLSELSNASFGQGITVTPIQMLQALSAVTNDGNVLKPYIVEKIVDSDGTVTYEGGKTVVKNVFKSETVQKVQELMYGVVYANPGNRIFQPTNVTVMGKTGTAQIASPNGGYLKGQYDVIKSFAVIFPKENPKYILYAVASKPKITSNVPWAAVVRTTIEEIASYAKLTEAKSDVDTTKIVKLDNYISTKVKDTKESLESLKLKPIVIGDGKYIINQYPLKESTALAGSKVFLLTNSNIYKVPDFTGWSLIEVKTFCNLINLKLEYSGYGYVTKQSIKSGSVVNPDKKTLTITLKK